MSESLSPPESHSPYPTSTNPSTKLTSRQPTPNTQRIRRRNRIITSCLECRKRKIKCDKLHPCTNCVKFARDCLFLAPALDAASQGKLTEIKERMGTLEKVLEQDAARQRSSQSLSPSSPGSSGGGNQTDMDSYYPEEEQTIETTLLTTEEAIYEDDADDEMMDLGVQLGKVRITERIGGFVRPKFAVELGHSIRRISADGVNVDNLADITARYHAQNIDSFLGPSPDYIVPQSSFIFPNGASEGNSLMMFLPSKQVANKVMAQYWTAVHPICRTVYRPAFERQYERFWSEISIGFEPSNSLQAVIFAALFSAVISMSNEMVTSEYGVNKFSLADNFRIGCESALSRAHLLRTTKVETLQAFVMYMIPLCRAEISRAHSALTASAIRLAECIGLHRDGSQYGLSPVEIHVRRLIWYQLCFLDMRCCWASGPRPQIREEEYDTKLPLNVNETELEYLIPPTQDADRWTDMTYVLMRFETIEMERYVWQERVRVEKKKASLTSLLATIQDFRQRMEQKYVPLMDERIPFQKLAMHYFRMSMLRYYVMALHRYLISSTTPLPERLENIVISASISVLEHGVALDTDPDLKVWSWYNGAYHQFQAAVLLAKESMSPVAQRESDRIWACLDYVFDIPAGLTPPEKATLVLGELRDRMEVYHAQRKQKAPTAMNYLKPVPPPYLPKSKSAGSGVEATPGLQSDNSPVRSTKTTSSGPDFKPVAYGNQAPYPDVMTDANGEGANSVQTYSSLHNLPSSQPSIPQSDDSTMTLDDLRRKMVFQGMGIPGPAIQAFDFNDVPRNDAGADKSDSMSPAISSGNETNYATIMAEVPPMGVDQGELGMEIDWNELDRLFPGSSAETFDFNIAEQSFSVA